jgi:hypothetical protein
MNRMTRYIVATFVASLLCVFYFGHVRPVNAAEERAKVVKFVAATAMTFRASCGQTSLSDYGLETDDGFWNVSSFDKYNFLNNFQLMRLKFPDITPSEVGLESFDDIEKLARACVVKNEKQSIDRLFEAVLNCKYELDCHLAVKELEGELDRLQKALDRGDFTVGEMSLIEEKLSGKRIKQWKRFGKYYEDLLAAYPSDFDYWTNPTVLATKTLDVYKRAGNANESTIQYVRQLERQAYARRIDYLVRLLDRRVEYPESAKIVQTVRAYLKAGNFTHAEFDMSDEWLERMIHRDPRVIPEVGPEQPTE